MSRSICACRRSGACACRPPAGWVSAKDVILEMLRRHGVEGGLGRIIEYHGPGLDALSAMDRHVIANMGAELGATTTVFPSDDVTRRFLARRGARSRLGSIAADDDAGYDVHDEIDLSRLEPLIAKPSSPGNVVPVREVAGAEIYQAISVRRPIPAIAISRSRQQMVRDARCMTASRSTSIPARGRCCETLAREGLLHDLVHAGARLHQAGCNGCSAWARRPAAGRNSLRTVPRNFPGAPAPAKTASSCAARRPRPPQR